MKILAICNFGENRSRHIAEILSKDHETKYFGVLSPPNNAQEMIDWADIVICASEEIENTFKEKFNTTTPIYHLHVNHIGFGFEKEIEEQLKHINFKKEETK